MRDDDADAVVARAELNTGTAVEYRLLDVEDATLLRGSAQQVLRTLKNEIPAQM